MKKMLSATMLATFLAAGSAYAQDATTPAQTPAATADPAPAAAVAPRFLAVEAADDWLASRMIGSTVYGTGDETLGDVNDVVIGSNGLIKAVVLGVGGFLGIGEKNVAVNPSAIERVRNGDTLRYRLATTKDELSAAPEFKPLDATDASSTSSTSPADPMQPAAPAAPAPAAPAPAQ